MNKSKILLKLIRYLIIPIIIGMIGSLIISIALHASFQVGYAYRQAEQSTVDELPKCIKILVASNIQIDLVSLRISYIIALFCSIVAIGMCLPDIASRESIIMVSLDIICSILSGIIVLLIVRFICLTIVYIGYYIITSVKLGYLKTLFT